MICAVAVALTASKTYACDLGSLARAEFPIPWTSDGRGGFEARDGAIQYVARIQTHTVWDAGAQFYDRLTELRDEARDGGVTEEEDLVSRGWPALRVVRSDTAPTVMGTYISMFGTLVYVEVRGVSPKSLAWRPQVRAFLASLKPNFQNPTPLKTPGPEWSRFVGPGYEVNHLRRVVTSDENEILLAHHVEYSVYADRMFITGKVPILGESIKNAKELEVYGQVLLEAVRAMATVDRRGIRDRNRIYLTDVKVTTSAGPPMKAILTAKSLEGIGIRIVLTPVGETLFLRCYAGPPCLMESPGVKNWFASFRFIPPLGTKG